MRTEPIKMITVITSERIGVVLATVGNSRFGKLSGAIKPMGWMKWVVMAIKLMAKLIRLTKIIGMKIRGFKKSGTPTNNR